MGHADAINQEALTREVLAGADAWQICDRPTATNRLRAGFEVLTQARERFYPVDAYLIDLCLLDPAMPAGVLAGPLESHVAVSFLAPAQAIENQAGRDPERWPRLRQAITEGWLDVAGGTYSEAEDAVLAARVDPLAVPQGGRGLSGPPRGAERRDLRAAAVRPVHAAPQIAKRFGFRFALHLGFDAGRFPIRSETKRLWEGPDGSSLESLLRPPLAADRPSQGLMLPWRLAATMRNDHVATLALVHWPSPVASWYLDLRRARHAIPRCWAAGSRSTTYFHLTDRPYETFRPDPDRTPRPTWPRPWPGATPSRSRGWRGITACGPGSRPSRRSRRWRRPSPSARRPETSAETAADRPCPATLADDRDARSRPAAMTRRPPALDRLETHWAGRLAGGIVAARHGEPRPRRDAGYLVINPLGVPRRVAVILPDAALDLRPEGPAPGRPVHRRGRLRRGRSAGVRLRLGPGRGRTSRCRRPQPGGFRPAAARSRTSRSSSRSTRPPAGSAA